MFKRRSLAEGMLMFIILAFTWPVVFCGPLLKRISHRDPEVETGRVCMVMSGMLLLYILIALCIRYWIEHY